MNKILKISEATSMAMHVMALLAKAGRKMTTREMAESLTVSEHHLSKVLQRLTKSGMVHTERGPKGGFLLGRPAADITLLHIYEVFEGEFPQSGCLFDRVVCKDEHCILGGLVHFVTREVREYLTGTRLSDVTGVNLTVNPPIEADGLKAG
jgi:Rrf2 family protein